MAEYNPSKIIKDGNTYNFRDTTKIPLAGSNEISGSLVPSTDGTVNLGSSSAQWNNAYIKSLAINGVAAGDILTHNASEFVLVSNLSTVATSGSYNDLSNKPTIPVIDSALSSTSENGLQNKVIKLALDGKANSTHTHTKSDITDFPTLATVATTGSYNDLTDKPTIPPSVEFASEQEVTDTVLSEMNYLL